TVLNTKKNQRLGDLAAGTLIIKTKIQTDINDMVFFELNEDYQPRFKEVMLLSDRDMNTIKGVLNNCRRYKTFDVAARMSEKIRNVLNIPDYQEPVEFLETLLKDYNYFSNQN
ncbi:MAG: RDD family protein, partial [Bacteroidia bacterium]